MEPAARFAAYAALLLAAGVPLTLTFARETGGWRLASLATLAAMAASLWWVLQAVAAMAALPLDALDVEMVTVVLEATPLGTVIAVRLVALAAALVALRRRRMATVAIAASLALATMAWTGHAGASEGVPGMLHRAADVLHLLAAATWLGALVLFLCAALHGGDEEALARRLSRFARLGSGIVLVLLITGIANSLIITGGRIDFGAAWFGVLAAKLGLFAAMLALAAGNRWWLVPALNDGRPGSLRAIRISLSLETAAACLIVALVSVLGTLTPG